MLWSEDVGLMVVDLSSFPDFVDGMRRFLVQGSTGTLPGRRATGTCASLQAAGLFIDSQSLVGDGASSDLAMVEAQRLFQRSCRRRWSLSWPLASATAGNLRDGSEFFYPLGCYLQYFQDNCFFLVCLLVSTFVCSCNLIFN
jgi:hypothetical protein